MIFFHAVTIQAVVSSFIAGYIRSVDIMSGMKYAVVLATITLITWTIVEQVSNAGSSSGEEAALLLAIGSTGWSIWGPDSGLETNADNSTGEKK